MVNIWTVFVDLVWKITDVVPQQIHNSYPQKNTQYIMVITQFATFLVRIWTYDYEGNKIVGSSHFNRSMIHFKWNENLSSLLITYVVLDPFHICYCLLISSYYVIFSSSFYSMFWTVCMPLLFKQDGELTHFQTLVCSTTEDKTDFMCTNSSE